MYIAQRNMHTIKHVKVQANYARDKYSELRRWDQRRKICLCTHYLINCIMYAVYYIHFEFHKGIYGVISS